MQVYSTNSWYLMSESISGMPFKIVGGFPQLTAAKHKEQSVIKGNRYITYGNVTQTKQTNCLNVPKDQGEKH